MSVTRGGRRTLCIFAISLGWALVIGGGARGEPPVRYHLRIASQPLDSALQEFARQSGIQVIYFSGITAGLRAPALDGYYTLDAAMRALLAGSKLTSRVINSRTVEIRPPPGTAVPRDHSQPTYDQGTGSGSGPGCASVTPFGGCIPPQIFNDVQLLCQGIRSCAR
jgi:hypothetical protein